METLEKYKEETENILMGCSEPLGHRPVEIRERVQNLLEIEQRARLICKNKYFKLIGVSCPFCGWTHD